MSEVALAPLSTLWSAMSPCRPVEIVPVDVGAIAAAAEAQGRAAGRAEALAEVEPLRAALLAATAGLERAQAIEPATLQPLFTDLVTRICTAVVGAELRLSPNVVARLVAAALSAVESGGDALVYLSPDDATLLSSELAAIPDPELANGEVRVETPAHVVAASLAGRLAAIVEGLA